MLNEHEKYIGTPLYIKKNQAVINILSHLEPSGRASQRGRAEVSEWDLQ